MIGSFFSFVSVILDSVKFVLKKVVLVLRPGLVTPFSIDKKLEKQSMSNLGTGRRRVKKEERV